MADARAGAGARIAATGARGLGIGLLLAPALLLLAVFFLLPLYELLRVSTLPSQAAVLHGTAWRTTLMYGRSLGDPFYRELMLNSVLVGLATTVAALLLGYPVAFYLTRASRLERTLISAACLLPLFVNAIVGILGWYILLLPFGVIQQILAGLGAWSGPLQVLHTFPALVAVLTYEHVPFAVLLLVASLQAIPPEQINAARLLGAGTVRIIWTLILPLSMPGLVATAVLVFSLAASSYLTPILIGGGSMRVLPLSIYNYGTDLLNWPLAAALSFLMLVLVGLIAYGFFLGDAPADPAGCLEGPSDMALLRSVVYLIVVLMLLPVVIIIPVALTTVPRISFPPVGIGLRWFAAVLDDPILLQSVGRSFWLAVAAAVLGVLIALPAAFAFRRGSFRGRHVVELLLTGPRMIPQIVLALGLLIWLEHLGLAASFAGLLAAHLVLTVPYAFSTLLVSVATLDRRLEWSSAVLGASPMYTFCRVVLPQIKTGMIAALIFGFILSFNNVTLALFVSDIGARTMPVELFNRMYIGGMTPVVPAFAVLLALCGVVLFVVLDLKVGVYRYLAGGR